MSQVVSGREFTEDVDLTCDVAIIGTGAGGAMLAAGLAAQGIDVLMLEAGSHRTKSDFTLQEADAYPMLYQERGGRGTSDRAISILQGQSVGGGTTVNWTTCYRTPDRIFRHWREKLGIKGWDSEVMAPHFDAVEERLSINLWPEALANANNDALLRGARALGYETHSLRRNVKGCANSGYCGMGCPVNGKQSAHLTTIPDALSHGARVYCDVRARRLHVENDRIVSIEAEVLDEERGRPTGRRVVVRPKICVSSCGAINGPALLLRSGINDNGRVGKRTFLHPVVGLAGVFEQKIAGWSGAPQSIGSHEFVDRGPDRMGYFLEVAPVHPMLIATSFTAIGVNEIEMMRQLGQVSAIIAVHVDGLLDGDDGGSLSVDKYGRIRLDYPISAALTEGFKHAHQSIARIHFAAGAKQVGTMHAKPILLSSDREIAKLSDAPYGALEHTIFSAHQMGGMSMGTDPATSVVDTRLRHHRIHNLFAVDGSALPTALGVNPSETIYALAHRAREWVAEAL